MLSEIPNDTLNDSVNNNEVTSTETSEINDETTNNDSNNSIERNEDWATVFLKWTDFRQVAKKLINLDFQKSLQTSVMS